MEIRLGDMVTYLLLTLVTGFIGYKVIGLWGPGMVFICFLIGFIVNLSCTLHKPHKLKPEQLAKNNKK